jgi:sec-independent protein translocase protein TatB
MFDFAWSEIALIVVVAVVFIGPKDLPVAIKAVTEMIKKARRMAGEFQTHVDEMVREADLHEVRDSINQIRNFDFKGTVERAVDPDGSLRSTFASNPLDPVTPAAPVQAETVLDTTVAATIEARSAVELVRPEGVDSVREPEAEPEIAPPAFIPPGYSLPDYLLPPKPEPVAAEPPAFVPPSIAAQSPARHS